MNAAYQGARKLWHTVGPGIGLVFGLFLFDRAVWHAIAGEWWHAAFGLFWAGVIFHWIEQRVRKTHLIDP